MLEPLREKQERPEMDDLEEKGKNYLKKIFGKFSNLPDTLANISANFYKIFFHIILFQIILDIFPEKSQLFLAGGGRPPPC